MAWNSSKDNNKGTDTNRSAASGGVNTIDANTKIEGTINADGNIRIDGSLIGNLTCGATLVIGPKGSIKGDVTCKKAIIEGFFEGNLEVKEDLTLEANSKVSGEVRAQKMAVLKGSQMTGRCFVPYTPGSNGKSANPLKTVTNAKA